jgi:hypothetical protein
VLLTAGLADLADLRLGIGDEEGGAAYDDGGCIFQGGVLCCRFYLIDFLLSKPRIARYLFDRFRTKENLRTVLQVPSLKSRWSCLSAAFPSKSCCSTCVHQ